VTLNGDIFVTNSLKIRQFVESFKGRGGACIQVGV